MTNITDEFKELTDAGWIRINSKPTEFIFECISYDNSVAQLSTFLRSSIVSKYDCGYNFDPYTHKKTLILVMKNEY